MDAKVLQVYEELAPNDQLIIDAVVIAFGKAIKDKELRACLQDYNPQTFGSDSVRGSVTEFSTANQ